jgi:outer membrane biosynthesis protein TonB
MPSQKGIKPEFNEVETTESNYQDGDLAHDRDGSQGEARAAVMEQEETKEQKLETQESEIGGTNEMVQREDDPAPPEEKLAETPFPVERPILPMETEEEPKSAPEEIRKDAERTEENKEVAENLKKVDPSPTGNQGFRGNQRRTELKGSISRGGRAALDIEAGELGKYHAAISRAIEQSWQRKVIQNLDYIKPGWIRVRVVLDHKGKVRSVGTVDEFGIGGIQKGFTHSSIRDAQLPSMPAEVKRELEGEPLELLYNFIF